jgi:hypothetical protein
LPGHVVYEGWIAGHCGEGLAPKTGMNSRELLRRWLMYLVNITI